MNTLEQIVAAVLELPEHEVDDGTGAATTAHWTSLRHLRIIAAVGREFGVPITPRQARSCRSVGDLRRLLVDHGRPA
ncbi:MAG TPA: acyl carrier protein [Pseudonocardiaceae bacterium]